MKSRVCKILSQNHRMFGVGRDLCGSSSPTLLPKQGHLQQAAQDLVQAGLEYLQRRRLHNLPEKSESSCCHRGFGKYLLNTTSGARHVCARSRGASAALLVKAVNMGPGRRK